MVKLSLCCPQVSLISIEYDLEELEATRHAIESGESLRAPVFGSNIGALKALRTFRAFRPLRAISRWQGMKVKLANYREYLQILAK